MVDNHLPDQPSPLVLGFGDLGTGLVKRPGKRIRTLDLILLCNTQFRGTWGLTPRALGGLNCDCKIITNQYQVYKELLAKGKNMNT